MDPETTVKLAIYDAIALTTRVPTAPELARSLGLAEADVLDAFASLHRKRLLVPEPGDPARIRMAPPFSGVQTTFRVRVAELVYDANCVWDAYGVAAALHRDGVVEATDGHTGDPMKLEVRDGRAVPAVGVAHFAVPAARWWEDIIHT